MPIGVYEGLWGSTGSVGIHRICTGLWESMGVCEDLPGSLEVYRGPDPPSPQGIHWFPWKGFDISIPFTEMKLRPQRG